MARRRQAWFDGQPDLDPERLIFIDESGATTKMARLRGRAQRGERCRAAIPHGHVWTPVSAQVSFEQVGGSGAAMCPASGAASSWPRARMGIRGSGPHHWSALEALPVRLVLLTPPYRRYAIPVL